jgi:hypothetical protein
MVDGRTDRPADSRALLEIIARAGAHRLIIGPHGHSNAMTFELLEAARVAGTRVSLLPDMLEVVGSSVDFDDLYGVTLLGVRHTELSRSSKRLKRAFDLIGGTLVLIAMAPMMAVIAVRNPPETPPVPRSSANGELVAAESRFRSTSSARWSTKRRPADHPRRRGAAAHVGR